MYNWHKIHGTRYAFSTNFDSNLPSQVLLLQNEAVLRIFPINKNDDNVGQIRYVFENPTLFSTRACSALDIRSHRYLYSILTQRSTATRLESPLTFDTSSTCRGASPTLHNPVSRKYRSLEIYDVSTWKIYIIQVCYTR